jgi:hypothetical protein
MLVAARADQSIATISPTEAPDIAAALENLRTCSGEYISATLRNVYADFVTGSQLAVLTASADALDAAAPLDHHYDPGGAALVAEHAGRATSLAMQLPALTGEISHAVGKVVEELMMVRSSIHEISERRPRITFARLG